MEDFSHARSGALCQRKRGGYFRDAQQKERILTEVNTGRVCGVLDGRQADVWVFISHRDSNAEAEKPALAFIKGSKIDTQPY